MYIEATLVKLNCKHVSMYICETIIIVREVMNLRGVVLGQGRNWSVERDGNDVNTVCS